MKKTLKIATRQSPLALWQANFVKQELQKHFADLSIELVPMTTSGDKFLRDTLAKVGGKGLFTKELEHALLKNEADIAVHSMKDLPVRLADDFIIAATLTRAAVNDVFISHHYETLADMPKEKVIGTSSLRRISQLKHHFPGLVFKPLRGNVNTRLAKLEAQEYDGIILAQAGIERLGLAEHIKQVITPEMCLPAAGQGILAIECRANDHETQNLLQVLHDKEVELLVSAERAMNAGLNGGCEVPIAAYATYKNGKLWLRGLVGNPDGSLLLTAESTGMPKDAVQLGQQVADELLKQGADKILNEVYKPTE